MKAPSALFAVLLCVPSTFAEQLSLEALALKVEALERKVEALEFDLHPTKKADTNSDKTKLPPLFIKIPKDGIIRGIDGHELRDEELIATIRRIVKKAPNTPIKISGDREVRHQDLARITGLCQHAGAWNISFTIDKPRDDEQAAPSGGARTSD